MNYIRLVTLFAIVGSGSALGVSFVPVSLHYVTAEREREELDAASETMEKSFQTRVEITAEVMAGRLPLLEAARGFRAAGMGNRPWLLQDMLEGFPGSTEDERACQWVVHSVKMGFGDNPTTRQSALINRLEAELQAYLSGHGGVQLQEVESIPSPAIES